MIIFIHFGEKNKNHTSWRKWIECWSNCRYCFWMYILYSHYYITNSLLLLLSKWKYLLCLLLSLLPIMHLLLYLLWKIIWTYCSCSCSSCNSCSSSLWCSCSNTTTTCNTTISPYWWLWCSSSTYYLPSNSLSGSSLSTRICATFLLKLSKIIGIIYKLFI